tara:strand:+ start:364 stop:663 length:300 start_codon:yes stop_codon:yes gene_type:complete
MNNTDFDHLRLIADPQKLIKKKNHPKINKNIKIFHDFMIYKYDISDVTFSESILDYIDQRVADYKLKLFTKRFVNQCIENAIRRIKFEKFDTNSIEELS